MSSRSVFASVLMPCLLAVGFLGIAPVANAETVGPPLKASKVAGNNVIGSKHRFRRLRRFHSVKIHLPMGPTSIYYDYPYYYSRGHYPTHIGGYVYYPHYYYYGRYHRTYAGPGSPRRQRARSN